LRSPILKKDPPVERRPLSFTIFRMSDTQEVYLTQPAAVLRIEGEDAVEFLQGQGTAAVPPVGGQAYTLFLDHKGILHADGHLLRVEEEALLLVSEGTEAADITARLERNLIADDVELTDLTGNYALRVTVSDDPLEDRWERLEGEVAGYRLQGRRWGPGTILQLLPKAIALEPCGAHMDAGRAEWLRLEAGCAWVGKELAGKANPLEAGLVAAIAFDKGCYLGQEVIARMHRLGRAGRFIAKLSSEVPQRWALAEAISLDDKVVGEIIAVHSDAKGCIALGLFKGKTEMGALERALEPATIERTDA
jgi:folate-binding protein YgfZ